MNTHARDVLSVPAKTRPSFLVCLGAASAAVIAMVLWSGLVMLAWNIAFPGHTIDLAHAAAVQALVILVGAPLLLVRPNR